MPARPPPALFRSVRGRLTLLVAALVGPVVGLAIAMVYQGYRNERATVATALRGTARAISGVVDAKLDEAQAVLKTLSTLPALAEGDIPAVDLRARQALNSDDRWFVLVQPDGQQLVNTALPPGAKLPKVEFAAEFQAAMARGENFISDLQRSKATGSLVLHISRPHFVNGELKYILTISLRPASLGRTVDVERYAPGRIVSIVDRKGTIITRSRNPEQFVGGFATPDIVKGVLSSSEGVVDSITLEHIPVVTAFSRARCGWSTVIGVPKAELYHSAQRLLLWGVVGSAMLIIVAVAMAVWIGRSLVRGAAVLEADAAALGRGEIPPDETTGLDESDFVADAMRRTAATLVRRTETLETMNRTNVALVAELQHAQQQLRQHARELETKVEERTASLREAVTQMEEFSYTVSHDLRAPLRAMHAFSGALLEEYGSKLDDTARDYLQRIQRASARMDALTRDLLSYSRIARAEVQLEPTDVEYLVRSALEHYSELQPYSATVRVESPLAPVLAHPPSLSQCLANLLTNAAKFVRPGAKPEVTVRTTRHEDRVRIWVEDRGIGIPPKYQANLFRVFERVPADRPIEGTGVGLAIVRKAAEKMSGTCGVESDGLTGSRFWIELKSV